MKAFRGYAMIAGAALLWGLSATLAKFLLNRQVDTLLIVQTRATFSACGMACALGLARRDLLRVRLRDLSILAALGVVGIAGANFTYYFMIKEATVAAAIVLQYTAPLLVVGYAALSGEEEITVVKVLAALLAVAGCALAVGPFHAVGRELTPGVLAIGLLSACCFAFLTIVTRHLLARYSSWTVMVYALACAALLWLVINPPSHIMQQKPPLSLWPELALLAVTSVLLPYALYFEGLRHVVPARAIIISTLEPVVAIGSAALLIGEALSPLQWAGTVVVLLSISILQLRRETHGEEIREGDHAPQ